MKNQTEVIDNFKPDEVIEPKRKYIGNMNYRNLQDPITYKTENELGLAIAEKLRLSNIRFSGVINEDKSISFSFDKKHQSSIYAFYDIRDSLEKQAHTAQRGETHKAQEQTSRDSQSDLKAILFQSVNNEYEKTVAFGQNDGKMKTRRKLSKLRSVNQFRKLINQLISAIHFRSLSPISSF